MTALGGCRQRGAATLALASTTQQGVASGFASATCHAQLHGIPGATLFKNMAQNIQAGGAMEYAVFFEQRTGVRRQHLGPLVAAVAGAIATGRDLRESMRETGEARSLQHPKLLAHPVQYVVYAAPQRESVAGVQIHVEQRNFQLSCRMRAGL